MFQNVFAFNYILSYKYIFDVFMYLYTNQLIEQLNV